MNSNRIYTVMHTTRFGTDALASFHEHGHAIAYQQMCIVSQLLEEGLTPDFEAYLRDKAVPNKPEEASEIYDFFLRSRSCDYLLDFAESILTIEQTINLFTCFVEGLCLAPEEIPCIDVQYSYLMAYEYEGRKRSLHVK